MANDGANMLQGGKEGSRDQGGEAEMADMNSTKEDKRKKKKEKEKKEWKRKEKSMGFGGLTR